MADLIDSYSETNRNTQISSQTYSALGQTFTGKAATLDSVKLYLAKGASPTGNIVAKIYAHTGTYGTDGKPTGAVLATSDNVDVSTISSYATFTLITFTFSGANRIALTAGTKYCVDEEYPTNATNVVYLGCDSTSPSHGGNLIYKAGSTWYADASQDACFYVYGEIKTAGGAFLLNLI